jgi:hypothetical protein
VHARIPGQGAYQILGRTPETRNSHFSRRIPILFFRIGRGGRRKNNRVLISRLCARYLSLSLPTILLLDTGSIYTHIDEVPIYTNNWSLRIPNFSFPSPFLLCSSPSPPLPLLSLLSLSSFLFYPYLSFISIPSLSLFLDFLLTQSLYKPLHCTYSVHFASLPNSIRITFVYSPSFHLLHPIYLTPS